MICHNLSKEQQMSEENQEVPGDYDYQDDFNLDSDYAEVPIVPGGSYLCNIVEVALNPEIHALQFKIQLQGNEAVCSDGVTPVDGQGGMYNIWLPKPGDANLQTPGGQNKKQWKINNLKESLDKLEIDAPTVVAMREQIASGAWLKDGVSVVMKLETYQGKVSSKAQSLAV